MKQRLYWLDNLKSFCILAVIASHVNSFVFGNGACFMNKAIDTFFMGTFFMVSGYLGYKSLFGEVLGRKLLELKTYSLLLPLMIVGSLYVLCGEIYANGAVTQNPTWAMITNGDQKGYWFLLTLFVFKLMALLTGVMTNAWGRMRCWSTAPLAQLLVFILLGGVICFVSRRLTGNTLWEMCFTDHLLYYMLFYAAGAFLHRLNLLPRLQKWEVLMAAMFALGIVLFTAYQVTDFGHPLLLITTYRMCIVVPMFVYFSKWMNRPMQRFTTLGVHSLELYVFHYFLIIDCTGYTATWIEGIKEMPLLFQLMLNGIVTAVIATVTLHIAQVANHNAAVKKFVLGKF